MKKFRIGILLLLLTAVTVGFLFLRESRKPKTFSSAEAICVKVLEKHRQEMEALASEKGSGTFRDFSYHSDPQGKCVSFSIGGQGMLGGQYWDLVYTADGTYNGETESYLFEEPEGNNICRAKRITGNWWYCWMDYDGTEKSWK